MSPVSAAPRRDRIEPLWDRVDANRIRLAAFVVMFVGGSALGYLVFLVMPYILLYVVTTYAEASAAEALQVFWPIMAVAGLAFTAAAAGWAAFTLLRSEKWLLRRLEATFVPAGELLDTKMALKDMAIAAGIPVAPALYLLDTRSTNAFVFAARRRRAVVGVTRGFLTKLSVDEQRAVFANLIARLRSGDTITSTGITALMWPVHAWRQSRLTAEDSLLQDGFAVGSAPEATEDGGRVTGDAVPVPFFLFGVGFAIVSEFVAAGHRRSQLSTAEKADAEGMLLLKDPSIMLDTLRRCVELDNLVPSAGEAFAELFYCWTGVATNDEDDPEWQRVARLREVLGADGAAWSTCTPPAEEDAVFAPHAPRLDLIEEARRKGGS